MKIGAKLKAARCNLGYTQQQVATHMHVSRKTISSWENNHSYPDIPTLVQLAQFYDLSLDDLLLTDQELLHHYQTDSEKLSTMTKIARFSYYYVLACALIGILDLFNYTVLPASFFIAISLAISVIHLLNYDDWHKFTNVRYRWLVSCCYIGLCTVMFWLYMQKGFFLNFAVTANASVRQILWFALSFCLHVLVVGLNLIIIIFFRNHSHND